MRNTIKKKITKGILLFLFTFFSVGVQGQFIDYKPPIIWSAKPVTTVNSPEYNENGTLKSWLHEIVIPVQILQDLNIPNINIDLVLNINAVNQSYDTSGSFGFDSSNINFLSLLESLFSSYGTSWGIGDSGSFVYDTGEGGGGSGPPPCAITSCPVGYYLSPYCSCILEPCDTDLKTKINTLANNAIVKTQILALKTSAKTEAFERSTRIDQNPTTSILTSPGLGNSGTSNSVPLSVGDTTIMTLHSHLYNGDKKTYPVHSAQDLYNQNELYKDHNNLIYNMTVSPTHAYILVTEDPYKLATFINENPEKITVNPVSGGFKKGSDAEKLFTGAYDRLRKQGENYISARASAFAYLIEYYDTGLALYESLINDDGSTDFHNKRTTVIVTPAQAVTATTPAVPESKSYTNNDCP